MTAATVLERIESGTARVAAIGLGYVGLPLAVEFAHGGLHTVGIELDRQKVERVNAGQSYIPDVDDVRESAAPHVIELLARRGARVAYHDPHVPEIEVAPAGRLRSAPLTAGSLAAADCVIVLTHHSAIDWAWVGEQARLVVDTRNVIPREAKARVVRL